MQKTQQLTKQTGKLEFQRIVKQFKNCCSRLQRGYRIKEMTDLEETKAEIRFSLGQMRALNRHHEFENSMRMLARHTIALNILPATGPVSAGGDQGRDFETYETCLPGQVGKLGAAIGITKVDTIGFCCTLQVEHVLTKLKTDINKMVSEGTRVSFVVAYCEANVASSERHKFQKRIKDLYHVQVEIFDGTAIADLLAQRHTYWIAEQYLHLSARSLPSDDDRPNWYEDDLERWRRTDQLIPGLGQVLDLSHCLRYSVSNETALRELPFWLEKMERFAAADLPQPVRRRAEYELVLAHLRGLDDMRSVDFHLSSFMESSMISNEPADLLDAAVLLMAINGACQNGLTNHSSENVMEWNAGLTGRVNQLLAGNVTPGQHCRLLEVKAYLLLQPDLFLMWDQGMLNDVPRPFSHRTDIEWQDQFYQGITSVGRIRLLDPEGALGALEQLLVILPGVPLFPVHQISNLLKFLAVILIDFEGYDAVVSALDQRTAEVAGGFAAGQSAKDRAISYLKLDRPLEALRYLHRTRSAWSSAFASRGLVLATMMTADTLIRLNLYSAAKYYALVAASIVQTDDFDLFPRALFMAHEAGYLQGAWISAAQLAEKALAAHEFMSEDPHALEIHEELTKCLYHLVEIQAVGKKIDPIVSRFVESLLDQAGMTEFLQEFASNADVDLWWELLSAEDLIAHMVEESGTSAFSDAGADREIRWKALGICWTVKFHNTFEETLLGERVAAAAQILISDLALRDPLLLPTYVTLEVSKSAADSQILIRKQPDRRGTRWLFEIPTADDADVNSQHQAVVGTLARLMEIVQSISLLPDDQIHPLFTTTLEEGLLNHVIFALPYDLVYSRVIDKTTFGLAGRHNLPSFRVEDAWPNECPTLVFPEKPGPGYSHEKGKSQAEYRYETLPVQLRSTLPVLQNSTEFRETINELHSDGWPDWQILLAVFNVAKNERLGRIEQPVNSREFRDLQRIFLEPEPLGNPVSPGVVTANRLRESAEVSLVSTLQNHWGLQMRESLVDIHAIKKVMVGRYRYGIDDVDHGDPFEA